MLFILLALNVFQRFVVIALTQQKKTSDLCVLVDVDLTVADVLGEDVVDGFGNDIFTHLCKICLKFL